MKIKIEDKDYKGKNILDADLETVSKIFKHINNNENIEDINFHILKYLTNIEEDILDIADIEDMHNLQLKLTDFKTDKEELEVYNSFTLNKVKYKTLKTFNNYSDIKLTRYQYKRIKEEIVKEEGNIHTLITYILANFFTENTEGTYKEKIENGFEDRMKSFKKLKFKYALPFLIKISESISTHLKTSLESFKK